MTNEPPKRSLEESIAILSHIRAAAEAALAGGVACLCLVLLRESAPKCDMVRLYGYRGGPYGEVLQAMPEGSGRNWKVVARFRADKLLRSTSAQIETLLRGGMK